MTATRTLRFGEGFSLEPADFQHRILADQWTAWDPDHAGRVDPRFWLEQDDDRDAYLASDRTGPVLFFKVIVQQKGGIALPRWKTAELHMQFMPQATQQDYERIRAMLMAGCPWLEQILIAAGVEEITFDSHSPALIAFTTKRLGFSSQGDGTLRKRLAGQAAAAK